MKTIRIVTLVLALSLLLAGLAGSAEPDAIDWWVLAGGGGPRSGNGQMSLDATLGQPVTGPSAGGDTRLNDGYWQPMPEPAVPDYHIYLPVVLREGP
jgi:hypothetical protein